MSRTSFRRFAFRRFGSLVAVVTAGCCLHSAAVAQQRDVKSSNTAGLHIYAAPDGETYFSLGRSEERRVGKECRSRWSPYH